MTKQSQGNRTPTDGREGITRTTSFANFVSFVLKKRDHEKHDEREDGRELAAAIDESRPLAAVVEAASSSRTVTIIHEQLPATSTAPILLIL
jgi:hypothetical protein